MNDFVIAPAGPYAIIAAGVFNGDGTPIGEPYNELEVDHINKGLYRLTTPYYRPRQHKEHFNYIVKATPINPELATAYKRGKFIDDRISQVSIQISELHNNYIELWITKPAVIGNEIQNIIKQDISYKNMIRHTPADMPFMVEISLYGFRKLGEIEGRLDINEATEEELAELPGVGDALAKRILERREEVGPFKTIDDLLNIRGISEGGMNEIRPHFSLEGKSP